MHPIKETLIKARARIDTADKWTQVAFARTASDHPTDSGDPNACKFCALGALLATLKPHEADTYAEAVSELEKYVPHPNNAGVMAFNDTPGRSHSEVLEIFDKAIANVN